MASKLFAAFFVVLAGIASADCRFNQQTGSMHIPFDGADTDREFFILHHNSAILQDGYQQGAARAVAWMTCAGLPLEIQALDLPGKAISISHNEAGESCAIVDINGAERAAPVWVSRISMIDPCDDGANNNMFLAEYYIKFNQAQRE